MEPQDCTGELTNPQERNLDVPAAETANCTNCTFLLKVSKTMSTENQELSEQNERLSRDLQTMREQNLRQAELLTQLLEQVAERVEAPKPASQPVVNEALGSVEESKKEKVEPPSSSSQAQPLHPADLVLEPWDYFSEPGEDAKMASILKIGLLTKKSTNQICADVVASLGGSCLKTSKFVEANAQSKGHMIWRYQYGQTTGFFCWFSTIQKEQKKGKAAGAANQPAKQAKQTTQASQSKADSAVASSSGTYKLKLLESNCASHKNEVFAQVINEFLHKSSYLSHFNKEAKHIMGGKSIIDSKIYPAWKQKDFIIISLEFKGKKYLATWRSG